jgi:ABC-2 type transport system permease protein
MAANSMFEPVRRKGWFLGFENMLRKENRLWWGTRRWLWQALLWLIIMNGMLVLMQFVLPTMTPDDGDATGIPNGIEVLFNMGITFLSLGAIVLCQGMVVDEKTSGTGEWVLSKPLSRPAFLLAKLVGNGLGILAVLVFLQSAVAYGLIWLKEGSPYPIGSFIMGVGLLSVHVLFYIALTMMVGVFVQNRGLVLAIPLGFLLMGGMLVGMIGDAAFVLPWPVANILPALVSGVDLPPIAILPFIMTGFWTVLFIAVSLWKFEQIEF